MRLPVGEVNDPSITCKGLVNGQNRDDCPDEKGIP
jgi:hypothetical protein